MQCMRLCPTEAIRVRQRKAQLLPGRCIDCGLCLRACPTDAITPRFDSFADFAKFKYTVAIPSPALYSQFGRLEGPEAVLAALQRAGFDEAVDMSAAVEAVLLHIHRLISEEQQRRPLISPFCPTVVRLIQVRYPELVDLIAAVESPQEIMAAAIRERCSKRLGLRREQIGVVYITPCAAKMVGLKLHTRLQPSNLSGAIAVSHIYGELRAIIDALEPDDFSHSRNGATGPALNWSILGGQGGSLSIENTLAVGGMQNVIQTLDDVEKGKLHDVDYIECRTCRDGCVDGCLMVENPYEARSKLMRLIRPRGSDIEENRPAVHELLRRSDWAAKPVVPRPQASLDPDMGKSLEKMQGLETLYERLPQIDCGACGSPTCRAFAEDVVQGRAAEYECLFRVQSRMRDAVSELNAIVQQAPIEPTRQEGKVE